MAAPPMPPSFHHNTHVKWLEHRDSGSNHSAPFVSLWTHCYSSLFQCIVLSSLEEFPPNDLESSKGREHIFGFTNACWMNEWINTEHSHFLFRCLNSLFPTYVFNINSTLCLQIFCFSNLPLHFIFSIIFQRPFQI